MNMVRHAADAIRLATGVARDGGEIRVEFRSRVRVENGRRSFVLKMTWTMTRLKDCDMTMGREGR